MTVIKRPLLSPIRFYPKLTFGSAVTFQNPDNRVSTGYNWEGVNSMQYYLPIPKQWADGQYGIDCLVNTAGAGTFYARLYDEDDVLYISLNVDKWQDFSVGAQWRVYLDCSGVDTGVYTIKLFDTAGDALLVESEALYIADQFVDYIPFEFWNFENDFGLVFDNGSTRWTSRFMVPVRMFDPAPKSEKEMYMDDPGTLQTLRSTMQRVYNIDSLPIPVHVAEILIAAFDCSELYLNRIKVNSEDNPEAEPIEGSNLKILTGNVTFVDFNTDYVAEDVETEQDDQDIDWASDDFPTSVITDNSIAINSPSLPFGPPYYEAISDSINYDAGEVILVKLILTDDGGADLPSAVFDSIAEAELEWGVNWLSYRVNATGSDTFKIRNTPGEDAVYTAVITVYKII